MNQIPDFHFEYTTCFPSNQLHHNVEELEPSGELLQDPGFTWNNTTGSTRVDQNRLESQASVFDRFNMTLFNDNVTMDRT